MSDIERRSYPMAVEIREIEEEQKSLITGHAAVFDSMSEEMWGFKEKIEPGAFAKSIKKDDVRALWNHNPDYVLGRNKANTLRLSEDEKGLAIEIDPPDTQWARDLMISMKRGDVSQMSFGFTVAPKGERWEGTIDEPVRVLTELRLFDVSPVTYPAYPATDVQARSALVEAGLDFERLNGILFRHKQGLELRVSDFDAIKASIDVLTSYLPSSQVADEPEPEPPKQVFVRNLLEMQAELARRKVV